MVGIDDHQEPEQLSLPADGHTDPRMHPDLGLRRYDARRRPPGDALLQDVPARLFLWLPLENSTDAHFVLIAEMTTSDKQPNCLVVDHD